MISSLLDSVCTGLAAIPFFGDIAAGICSFFISIFSSFGL